MSSHSFNIDQNKEGFTPYHSPLEGDLSQLSLFSKLNLNSQASLDESLKMTTKLSSCDYMSVRHRRRKGSAEIELKQSIRGKNTFLKKSLIGQSSINQNDLNFQHDISYQSQQGNNQLSQRSCPVNLPNKIHSNLREKQIDNNFNEELRGRFHKTKNLLRTMSTYFHRFLNHNKRAHKLLNLFLIKMFPNQNIQQLLNQFQEWISKLSMNNFQQYQQVWGTNHKFLSLYRQLSYNYYLKEAYCDIYQSRLSKQTKQIAIKLLYQFIQGLQYPSTFLRFK